MSDRAKYVVFNQILSDTPECVPYVFPDFINHRDFVRQMGGCGENVVSAGFVQFGGTLDGYPYVTAFGGSTSLGIDADDGDSALIARVLGFPLD